MNKKNIFACTLLALVFFFALLFSSLSFAEPVPKSETIIIPGQLNDSREHAQAFDHETEYVYGNAPEQSTESQLKQKQPTTALFSSITAKAVFDFAQAPAAWRKTVFDKAGTLVVTLGFDAGSDYSVEVYNSCSNKNFCSQYEFGRFKTCTLNIEPGEFYFKITNNSGNGKYFLDVDLIENKQVSNTTASNCAKISCSQNKDCGTDSPPGEKYCNSNAVYQKYNKVFCNNAGQDNAFCSSAKEEQLIEKCSGNCANGACEKKQDFALNCPTEPINNSYTFSWEKGQFSNFAIQFSYTKEFSNLKYFSENTQNNNSYNVNKKYKALLIYEKKAASKQLYVRIRATKGKEKVYSNTCTFELEQQNKLSNQATSQILEILWNKALFSPITKPITPSKNNTLNFSPFCRTGWKCKTPDIKGYQKANCTWSYSEYCEFGCEQGKCLPNPATCEAGYKCKPDGNTVAYQNNDCTWSSPTTHCFYGCTNGECQDNPNPCQTGWKCKDKNTVSYQTTDCSWEYNTKCTYGCKDGECLQNLNNCEVGWKCKDANAFGFQKSDCDWLDIAYCIYGCINGKCVNGPETCHWGWVCKDDNTIAYQTANCELTNLSKCQYGCKNGMCSSKPPACQAGYKCQAGGYTKSYQNQDCSWDTSKESICMNGCSQGKCKGSCTQGWYCLFNTTKVLMASDCSYTQKTKCPEADLGIGQCINNACVCNENKKFCTKENGTEYSVRRNSDCSIAEKTKCDYGCGSWGKCNYQIKWLCIDQKTKAIQNKDGSISSQTNCPNGCVDGNCVECNIDSDCGSNTFLNNPVCKNKDLYQNYRTYSCKNPGTTNSQCTYSDSLKIKQNCNNGCSNGKCTGCSTGWKCKDSTHDGYQKKDCTWNSVSYCANGCSKGECNDSTCSSEWKCKNSSTKAYQNQDCSWSNEKNCDNGCSNGACNPSQSCANECSSGQTRCNGSNKQTCGNYDNDSCTEWGNDSYCNNGCSNGNCISVTSHAYSSCYNNNLYWFNSSGQREELKQECYNGCSNAACLSGPQSGDHDYCTPEQPCLAGEGHCKKNNDCQVGLRCVESVGANYGYSTNVNVCEAPVNIFNQNGWKCKDSKTMAYLLSDGTWTNELLCKHGCSNGSCFMPAICDTTTSNLAPKQNSNEIYFSEPQNTKKEEKTALLSYPAIAATMFETVFSSAILISMIVIFQQMLVEKTQSDYFYSNLPRYNGWEEGYLQKHYDKHSNEWDYYITKPQYEDICKRVWESLESEKIDQTKAGLKGDFGAYLASENIFVAITKEGKMVTCFKPLERRKYIDDLLKQGAKPIPLFNNCEIYGMW